jgi:aryl carrier-like protein
MPGVTLDAGGMIALDRNDRRVVALLARARETGARVTIPATALAQAIRRPDRQVRLARLVRQPTTWTAHQ